MLTRIVVTPFQTLFVAYKDMAHSSCRLSYCGSSNNVILLL